jgi:predicted nucleic acid-binding protein
MFLSVVAIHEIKKFIALLEHKGATAKAAALKLWLAGLVATYNDKIIPIDTEAAPRAGRLEAKATAASHTQGMADATLAGTAQARNLIILTHNTKHVLPLGIAVATPDEAMQSPVIARSP